MTGKRVKIAGQTSETSEFWALPSGAIEAEVHAGPVRMPDGAGGWSDVDVTLRRASDGSVAPIAHPYGLRLSGASTADETELVSLGTDGERSVLGWLGHLPQPVLEGTKGMYPEARPGVDLVVSATRTGYERGGGLAGASLLEGTASTDGRFVCAPAAVGNGISS
ncbi:hypothetical protein [Polymorphospora lycopeni]|uniref:Uncharacterized protein n=1 Tax=Polymorphospora lycopeni TaxID=3140240 RepID=A0ABV5D2S9_9ACTN